MSFWKSFFGKTKTPAEERRERIDDSDQDRVSCMDVARTIRDRVAAFNRSSGMVVVLLEGCRVQIYYFDGVARTSWGYNNHQFSTDRVGETFLVGPPTVLALTVNTEHLLTEVIEREFADYDMNIGPLWKLDPAAWDYEMMKALHEGDVGIRISFDQLPAGGNAARDKGAVSTVTKRFIADSPTSQAVDPRVSTLLEQGAELTLAGNEEKARSVLNEALAISKGTSDIVGHGNALRALAFLDGSAGQYEKARNCMADAVALFQQGNHKIQEAYALMGLGNCEKALGNSDAAKRCFKEAAAIYESLGMSDDMERALANVNWVE